MQGALFMITEHNGLMLFPIDEDFSEHPLFKDLQSVSLGDVRFPYGFFVKENGGARYVVPATPEERGSILLNAFPDMTLEQAQSEGCGSKTGATCVNTCDFPFRCMRVVDQTSGWHGCFCKEVG
jgi:hypothetical protein